MPPRLRICPKCLHASPPKNRIPPPFSYSRYATTASAIAPASSLEQMATRSIRPLTRYPYPPTQPPSHRPPEFRKSQLHRQYTSLLRSTPLMLIFQHNNLKATEWMGIRREMGAALRKLDEANNINNDNTGLADGIKIQIIQTGIFAAALRVVEFFHPEELQPRAAAAAATAAAHDPTLRHALSRAAHAAVVDKKRSHALAPLLSGPLAVVTFPTVSPSHLKTALSILAPAAPSFPAPTRRANPGYHDVTVQAGLQKLLLLGARVEGKVFDGEGTRWVGGIEGGLEGLRAQVLGVLRGVGAGVTGALEGVGRSLYFAVEGRRGMLEDEVKEKEKEKEKEGESTGKEGGGGGGGDPPAAS